MGQVIAFPQRHAQTHERLSAALNALCAITYVLGFFIAGPMLGMFAVAFVFTAQPVAALVSVAVLAIVLKLTRAAYTRL
jgi:VIT1/CCC1 family predicted Fe2+/Mn2+ transporter